MFTLIHARRLDVCCVLFRESFCFRSEQSCRVDPAKFHRTMHTDYEFDDVSPLTGYQRVLNGEIRNGWQLAIPIQQFCKDFDASSLFEQVFYWPPHSWTTDHPDESVNWPPMFSADFLLQYPAPDGNRICSIRRHSLVKSDASTTLLKAVVPKSWSTYGMDHLSSRVIALVFGKHNSNRWRLILVDAMARSNRIYTIEKPEKDVVVSLIYVADGHLHIVFYKKEHSAALGCRVGFIDAKYNLQVNGPLICPISWESISFPFGQRPHVAFFKSGIPMVVMAYDVCDLDNGNKHFCFTFDHEKKWRLDTLSQWLASYTSTKRGSKIMNAADALVSLSPPASWFWFQVPAVRGFSRLFTVHCSDELICTTKFGGILRRWINPPSLKRIAAQAFFSAHPDSNMCEVREATGVDISDGIPEDGTEEEVNIVYCDPDGALTI